MCTPVMIFRFLILLALLPLQLGAQPKDSAWYSIKAFLPQWNNTAVQLIVEGQVTNKAGVQKDMYSFTGTANQPKTAVLSFKKEGRTTFLPIFIEPGTIKVRDDGKKLVASGTPLNDE